jgi:hypothetical protein
VVSDTVEDLAAHRRKRALENYRSRVRGIAEPSIGHLKYSNARDAFAAAVLNILYDVLRRRTDCSIAAADLACFFELVRQGQNPTCGELTEAVLNQIRPKKRQQNPRGEDRKALVAAELDLAEAALLFLLRTAADRPRVSLDQERERSRALAVAVTTYQRKAAQFRIASAARRARRRSVLPQNDETPANLRDT